MNRRLTSLLLSASLLMGATSAVHAALPIGTPGMPGPKRDDWNVYQFTDQEASPFMTL